MTMANQTSFVLNQVDGAVGRIQLNRPDKFNAMSLAMWHDLAAAIDTLEQTTAVRLITLGSADPRAFCAGADIEDAAQANADPGFRAELALAIRTAQHRLARCSKPTIAAIQGLCVGGGCGLALACDIRVADESIKVGITPAKLGLVYSLHDTRLLVDLVGPGRARMILYTGRLFRAEAALAMGLIDELAAPDSFQSAVAGLEKDIIGNSAHSIGTARQFIQRILNGQRDDDDATADMFEQAFAGRHFSAGLKGFRGRKTPDFPSD